MTQQWDNLKFRRTWYILPKYKYRLIVHLMLTTEVNSIRWLHWRYSNKDLPWTYSQVLFHFTHLHVYTCVHIGSWMIINKHVNMYLKRTANLVVFIKHITDYRELMSREKNTPLHWVLLSERKEYANNISYMINSVWLQMIKLLGRVSQCKQNDSKDRIHHCLINVLQW